ncbi:thermonuclease family protein [Calothrix sp. FACHB-156]|nr:thermonuclease family protein [Calothrix sp. FACHB-156]
MWKKLLNSPAFLLTFVAVIALAATLFPKTKSLMQVGAESPNSMRLSEHWEVKSVADGDTITVRQTDGKEMKVRLGCIDAPEIPHGKAPGQPFGNEAKEKLRSLVAAANNQVMIIPVESDRYGRTVAEVMASGKDGIEVSFQEEMLKSGLAYFYKQYASKCPNYLAFEQAQKIAITSKAGVWGQSGLEKPWDYRKRYR